MTRWRYIAQHPLTGEFIDWNVPLSGVKVTRRLSGPWSLEGTIEPEYARMLNPETGGRVLDEWRAALWAEVNGRIRGGGILTSSKPVGSSWSMTCDGYVRYLHGLPYTGRYRRNRVDPLDAYRHLWAHAQSFPDGDLGVVVDDTTSPVRVDGGEDEPYELAWWDAPDCGDEADTLAKETPFDYVEAHQWAEDGSDAIEHRVDLGYPRLGRRRTDLAFVEGENLQTLPEPERDGDVFAQYVIGLGAGEGRDKRRTGVVGSADGRLRRVHMLDVPDVKSRSRLRRLAASEQRTRKHITSIGQVVVADHANARLGAWELGDEVLIQARAGWADETVWCRIVEETITPEAPELAVLKLTRADGL